MPSTKTDLSLPVEIKAGHDIYDMTFSADGKHLVSSSKTDVRVWRVQDGEQIATMYAKQVYCLAVSRDGKHIAAGTLREVIIWDAKTYKQELVVEQGSSVHGVDFSPDGSRLVAASQNRIATVWHVLAGERLHQLNHDDRVIAAKYSPHGKRIATATPKSVRVWNSDNDNLLVDVNAEVIPIYNTGLLWFDNHLLAVSHDKIKQINASTGSIVSGWPIDVDASYDSCMVLPQHGKFFIYAGNDTIICRDTAFRMQLCPVQKYYGMCSLALSPDEESFAVGARDRKIVVRRLSDIMDTDLIPPSLLHPTLGEPEINIENEALELWKNGHLVRAETLLTTAITKSTPNHHALAGRALIRTRLGQWDGAIVDAEESIKIQRSAIGYIAKCVALVGMGKRDEGMEICDMAFEHFHSNLTTTLLLIKAVVLSTIGEHRNAISRIEHLISDVKFNSAFYVVQAQMYFLYGNSLKESGDHNGAIHAFVHAQKRLGKSKTPPPLVVSLITGWSYDSLVKKIQQHFCEAFLAAERVNVVGEAIPDIVNTFLVGEWTTDLKSRCLQKLRELGDDAINARQYDEAISHYTIALQLKPSSPRDWFIQRSRAYLGSGLWDDSLNDANEAIGIDPWAASGYERKHAALHGAGRYDDAADTFNMMITKTSQSSDRDVGDHFRRCIQPARIKEVIRIAVQNAISDSPLCLIDTRSGRLLDKPAQATLFESQFAFLELISSATTSIDHARIKSEVSQYFQYAMFSHKWEDNEPVFDQVIKVPVYDLEELPTHKKLQMFCKIAREAGFNWAWSDTCCINKGDNFVLQEALVSMFKWYRGSAMTIVFLLRVPHLSKRGALTKSIWNTRAWTLQEYHASRVVRFYTEDWTPYLNLTIYNHKESPEIISEMEEATGVSSRALMALSPGAESIREKLHLASGRETTRVEDTAYSLLGIFRVSLPVTYGEGDQALGRLLAQLLMNSGDTTILAWSGRPSTFNSCLPGSISVFTEFPAPHVPQTMTGAEMEAAAQWDPASVDAITESVMALYKRLHELPVPSFAGQRMRLPCLRFKLGRLSASRTNGSPSERIFHAQTTALGAVDIRTMENISALGSLYLVHPWIDYLLDRRAVGRTPQAAISGDIDPDDPEDASSVQSEPMSDSSNGDSDPVNPDPELLSPVLQEEMETRARGLFARLKQPFGALLLTPTRRNVEEYRRVATESLITVQVKEVTPGMLEKLAQSVRVLDVL